MVMNTQEIKKIQAESLKKAMQGNPPLNEEGEEISNGKRKSIDQPPLRKKIDPLR